MSRGRWNRRTALVAWRVGQLVCGLCCIGAAWVLFQSGLDIPGQVCAAALLLVGCAALISGRALRMIAARGTRRHMLDY